MRRLLFLNFRNVYRLSRWLRRRFTGAGTWVLGGMVGAGVFGIDTRQTFASQISTLCFMLLLIAAFASIGFRPRLKIHRRLPQFVTAGTPFQYTLTVDNQRGRPEVEFALLEVLDSPLPKYTEFKRPRLSDRGRNWFDKAVGYPRWLELVRHKRGADIDRVALAPLPPNGESQTLIEVTPYRRGYLHFTDTLVLRPDPLGLIHAIATHTNLESLLVLPKRYALPPIRLSSQRRFQPGGEGLASSVGDSQEFSTLRDYRPGDPMRNIHWRSWAKIGKPVVKEFQDEFFDRNALVLDTFGQDSGSTLFEEAISVAASFACADWGPDSLLDFLFVGHNAEQFTSGRGLADTANMLEVLACVQPSNGDFTSLSNLVLGHSAQLSGVVCVLLQWDAPRQRFVEQLLAKGFPVIVMLVTEPNEIPLLGPMAAHQQNFCVVAIDNVAEDLMGLGNQAPPAKAEA